MRRSRTSRIHHNAIVCLVLNENHSQWSRAQNGSTRRFIGEESNLDFKHLDTVPSSAWHRNTLLSGWRDCNFTIHWLRRLCVPHQPLGRWWAVGECERSFIALLVGLEGIYCLMSTLISCAAPRGVRTDCETRFVSRGHFWLSSLGRTDFLAWPIRFERPWQSSHGTGQSQGLVPNFGLNISSKEVEKRYFRVTKSCEACVRMRVTRRKVGWW